MAHLTAHQTAQPTALQLAPQWAAYAAVRAALMVPLIAGINPSRRVAAALGQQFAALPFNRRRLRRAADAIARVLPHLGPDERLALARRSYEHLAMLAVEVAFMPRMLTPDSWARHCDIGEMFGTLRGLLGGRSAVMITGHTGNWEVLGATLGVLGFPLHALYRPLDLAPLDAWLRRTRAACGLDLVDKFGAAQTLPGLIAQRHPIGFVADQNAGDRGLFVPFFGRLTSTYKTIALLAVQNESCVICGQARRVHEGIRQESGGFHFRVEVPDVITPDDWRGQPDPVFYVTARYRRAIERMVLNAPEQYLWMHRIWKSRPRHERDNKPFPPALRDKLAALPWMTQADVDAVVAQSDEDRAYLAAHNTDRLP